MLHRRATARGSRCDFARTIETTRIALTDVFGNRCKCRRRRTAWERISLRIWRSNLTIRIPKKHRGEPAAYGYSESPVLVGCWPGQGTERPDLHFQMTAAGLIASSRFPRPNSSRRFRRLTSGATGFVPPTICRHSRFAASVRLPRATLAALFELSRPKDFDRPKAVVTLATPGGQSRLSRQRETKHRPDTWKANGAVSAKVALTLPVASH